MPLIPIDPKLIEPFNQAIMRLLRPSHLRDERYITDKYCGAIHHPLGDDTAWPLLDLPDEETVPIHVEATGEEMQALLGVFVRAGGLTQEEADGITAAIGQVRGRKVRVADFIPPSWQPYIMSKEQATAAGYFSEG